MTASHTPGPYKVHRYVTRGQFVTETCIRSADDSYLAHVGPVNIEANAALFAAAPEMLEAIKDFLVQAELSYREEWDTSPLAAAIAKAEGRA